MLVFDDLNRSRLDFEQIVGNINNYCENKGFKTIIIANEEAILASPNIDALNYRVLKAKTIARTVRHIPDYSGLVHSVIAHNKWPSQEYATFLGEHEQVVYDVFASDMPDDEDTISKNHNIRSLVCALQEFCRIYEILAAKKVTEADPYLYSFIAYMLVSKNGIIKDGQICFDVEDAEIKRLYPRISFSALPESVRCWIDKGVWEEDEVIKELSRHIRKDRREKTES